MNRSTAKPDARRTEFEEVALPHLPSLYNFALRLVRDGQNAEDLVQDTILRAYRFFDRFEPGTNVRAWLFKILKNTFVNQYHYRNRRPEQKAFADIEGVDELGIEGNDRLRSAENPETEFFRGTVEDEVDGALGELPRDFRDVVHLNLVEGFTYQETADILSIPIGTVMSRLHRGRKLLQKRLLPLALERGFEVVGSAGGPDAAEAVEEAHGGGAREASPERFSAAQGGTRAAAEALVL